MNSPVSKELLFKYFEGGATAFQKELIDQWIKQGNHRELFYEYLMEWERQNPQYVVDVAAARERHRERMSSRNHPKTGESPSNESEPTPLPTRARFSKRTFWLVAASISLILLAGLFVERDALLFRSYRTGFGETDEFTLTDGSVVSLNANSVLKVPRFGFGRQTREVYLNGEANFSVRHTIDNQKFIIKTDKNLKVVVLGTEFTVYARQRGAKVVLNRGKVQLNYQEGKAEKQLVMKPGDLVTLDTNGQANIRKIPEPQNYSAWKEHRFVFEGTTLAEITQIFDDTFGVRVEISDHDLAQWTVTGSFTANNAEELLEVITEASNLSYHRKGKLIIISQR